MLLFPLTWENDIGANAVSPLGLRTHVISSWIIVGVKEHDEISFTCDCGRTIWASMANKLPHVTTSRFLGQHTNDFHPCKDNFQVFYGMGSPYLG